MTSKANAWMPFYVGDYLAATGRLTTEQHGAYLLILLDYWKNGPPPNDDAVLAATARLSPAAWRKAKAALIGFFDISDGVLVQKRVEKERARAVKVTEERRESGKAGAAKRWQNNKQTDGKRIANAIDLPMANGSQNDAPSHKKSSVDKSTAQSDLGKTLFDQGVALLVGKGRTEQQARSVLAKFQRDFGDSAVLDAINKSWRATDPVSAIRTHLGKTKAQAEYYGV